MNKSSNSEENDNSKIFKMFELSGQELEKWEDDEGGKHRHEVLTFDLCHIWSNKTSECVRNRRSSSYFSIASVGKWLP